MFISRVWRCYSWSSFIFNMTASLWHLPDREEDPARSPICPTHIKSERLHPWNRFKPHHLQYLDPSFIHCLHLVHFLIAFRAKQSSWRHKADSIISFGIIPSDRSRQESVSQKFFVRILFNSWLSSSSIAVVSFDCSSHLWRNPNCPGMLIHMDLSNHQHNEIKSRRMPLSGVECTSLDTVSNDYWTLRNPTLALLSQSSDNLGSCHDLRSEGECALWSWWRWYFATLFCYLTTSRSGGRVKKKP